MKFSPRSLCAALAAAAALLLGPVAWANDADPQVGHDPGTRDVVYDHPSPLTVVETITDVGGGVYRYSYSLTNVDSSPIWHFFVYSHFATNGDSGGTLFNGHASWGGPVYSDINAVYPAYDARNLDPAIVGDTYTWSQPFMDPATSIQVGESTGGFSFTASTLDNAPKLYGYETLASGWAGDTGIIAAVGYTPEPQTLSLLSVAALTLLRRR